MTQHQFEMALTREDFLRLLPVAAPGARDVNGDDIHGESAGVTWQITLETLEPRRIALLSLPRLGVKIALDSPSEAAADEWLRRFLLGFQRAGG